MRVASGPSVAVSGPRRVHLAAVVGDQQGALASQARRCIEACEGGQFVSAIRLATAIHEANRSGHPAVAHVSSCLRALALLTSRHAADVKEALEYIDGPKWAHGHCWSTLRLLARMRIYLQQGDTRSAAMCADHAILCFPDSELAGSASAADEQQRGGIMLPSMVEEFHRVRREYSGQTMAERPPASSVHRSPASSSSSSFVPVDPYVARWTALVRDFGLHSPAVDKLLAEFDGLDEIKTLFLDMYTASRIEAMQGANKGGSTPVAEPLSAHAVFEGNPGTGKTSVARLYAEFLGDIGRIPLIQQPTPQLPTSAGTGPQPVGPSSTATSAAPNTPAAPSALFKECSAAKLISDGMKDWVSLVDSVDQAGGGAIFIDEAYLLEPATSHVGKQIVNHLLTASEDLRHRVVFILAGYKRDMDKLFEYNPGFPSRFSRRFVFHDFSVEQLERTAHVWLKKLVPGGVEVDPKHVRILSQRVGRQAHKHGFGNAREVRSRAEAAVGRQRARVGALPTASRADALRCIERDDLLGPRALPPTSPSITALHAMVGLDAVKKRVADLQRIHAANIELEEREEQPTEISLNKLFLGPPGTGKTEVAQLYARILCDLGLLSKGEMILKKASDFIGSVVGESEAKTVAILEQARGSALVIDEAYVFCSSGDNNAGNIYGKAVIDTLVANIQGGDDRAVFLLGYAKEMEYMLNHGNDGLKRRFSPDEAFRFVDYTSDELYAILTAKAAKFFPRVPCSTEMKLLALKQLELQMSQPNFGNGGAVHTLLRAAQERYMARTAGIPLPLERSDFLGEDAAPAHTSSSSSHGAGAAISSVAASSGSSSLAPAGSVLDTLFDNDAGRTHLRDAMESVRAVVEQAEQDGIDAKEEVAWGWRFTGPPGTGKTTEARKLGKFFHALGLLPSHELVEVSAADFTTRYAGQATSTTENLLRSALGKTLFVDEAYRLDPSTSPENKAALDHLLTCMTRTEYERKVIVVLAGYEDDVNKLMASNPGFARRFPGKVAFPPFNLDESQRLLKQRLAAKNVKLSAEAAATLPALLQHVIDAPGWSSAGDIITLDREIRQARTMRLHKAPAGTLREALPADLQHGCRALLETRVPSSAYDARALQDQLQLLHSGAHITATAAPPTAAPATFKMSHSASCAHAAFAVEEKSDASPPDSPPADVESTVASSRLARPPVDPGVTADERAELEAAYAAEEDRLRREEEERARLELEAAEARRRAEEARLEIERLERLQREAEEEAERQRLAEIQRQAEEARRLIEIEQARIAEAQRQAEAERQRALEVQRRIRSMGVCPMNFAWLPVGGGYRCSAGGHYLSAAQLGV